MARIDDLEFRITATTDTLRADLARGNQQVDQFASRTASSFSRVDSAVTKSVRSMRQFAAFFGVGFGVNALRSWITSAVRAAEATEGQTQQLRQLAAEMKALKETSDALAISVGERLEPAMTLLRRAFTNLRQEFAPTDLETFNTKMAVAKQRIEDLTVAIQNNVNVTRHGGLMGVLLGDAANDRVLAKLMADLKQARMDLAVLTAAAPRNVKPLDKLVEFTGRPNAMPADLRRMPNFASMIRSDARGELQELSGRPNAMPAEMRQMPNFVAQVARINDEWEKYDKNMEVAKRRQEDFATAFAATFESRGMEALIEGDLSSALKGFISDLAQLIVRMKVLQPLAESIGGAFTRSGIAGLFSKGAAPGGGASLGAIEGWRASGGPVAAGKTYMVGEKGREWFVPDVAGRIMTGPQMAAAGSGATVVQNFYTQAGLPPQWEAAQIVMADRAAQAAYMAVMGRLGGRR